MANPLAWISGGPIYEVNEGFEETNSGGGLGSSTDGYDSASVHDQGPSTDPDFSTSGLSMVGSQCLKCTGANSGTNWRPAPEAGYFKLYVYFKFRISAVPAQNTQISDMERSGVVQSSLTVLTTGQLRFLHGTVSADTVSSVSANTTYDFWITWNTDGTGSAGFTTDGTAPTGNNLASVTGGTGTTPVYDISLGIVGAGAVETCYFDRFLISQSPIPNSP